MIELRALSQRREFEQVVDLQKRIWGFADIELLPVRLFVVAHKIGGQVLGAYDGDLMAGFVLAIPGLKAGGAYYLHSHMLGVLPEYRNHGVGRMLKLRQREEALGRGIQLIEWTFDPLELKNAFFNMERLGAIVRRYVENQYGTTSSPLHGGLPTDRCIAEWWLSSPHAETILAGHQPTCTIEQRVELPANIDVLRREQPRQARGIQEDVGRRLMNAFADGLAVVGFDRTAETGSYLLGRWPCVSNT